MGENPNAIEDEYIENLQQQIHFMELELKLLKEKQDEEEKSGGAGGVFIDEKTATQHLTLLKEKYQKMHKELEKQISDLTQHRNELQGVSSTLNQRLMNVTQQLKELEDAKSEGTFQGGNLLDRLESESKKRSEESSMLEQHLREVNNGLKTEIENNLELKRQAQEKEMRDNFNQERAKVRIAQQEKLIAKLKEDLGEVTENMVRLVIIQ